MPRTSLLILLVAATMLLGACADPTGPPATAAALGDSTSTSAATRAAVPRISAQFELDPDYALSW